MNFLQVMVFCCFSVSALPSGSPPSATLQTHLENVPSGTGALLAESTMPATEEKPNQKGATKLSDTTVVIIVSVSLALLVCAIIPLVFYRNWRSSADAQDITTTNKGDVDGNSTRRLHPVQSSGSPSTNVLIPSLFAAPSSQPARATIS